MEAVEEGSPEYNMPRAFMGEPHFSSGGSVLSLSEGIEPICYNIAVKRFTRVYIVGWGFLSGLFMGIGVDPDAEIIKALLEVAADYSVVVATILRIVFVIGGLYSTIRSVIYVYSKQGQLGVVAVGCAFVGGLMLGLGLGAGILFLIVGILIGEYFLRSNFRRTRQGRRYYRHRRY